MKNETNAKPYENNYKYPYVYSMGLICFLYSLI